MKKTSRKRDSDDDMLPEYDFSNGERGRYAKHFTEGVSVVVLAPDVAEAFPTARSVNAALRRIIRARSPQPVSRKKS
jgi:hypothetical protein